MQPCNLNFVYNYETITLYADPKLGHFVLLRLLSLTRCYLPTVAKCHHNINVTSLIRRPLSGEASDQGLL